MALGLDAEIACTEREPWPPTFHRWMNTALTYLPVKARIWSPGAGKFGGYFRVYFHGRRTFANDSRSCGRPCLVATRL